MIMIINIEEVRGMLKKQIEEKLLLNSYKLTDQRRAILDTMLENQGKHLSAEEVFYMAKDKLPNIGIATVYRTLERLAKMDILAKHMFAGDKYRYELVDDSGQKHHHIICLECGEITEVEKDLLHNLEQLLEEKGYRIVDHDLKLYVYCPKCRQKKEGV